MEIFVSEKDMPKSCFSCKISYRDEDVNCPLMYEKKTNSVMDVSHCSKKRHEDCPLKSLDQHDSEIRANERQKVIEELEEWHYKKLLEVREKEKKENRNKGNEDEMARLYALFLGRYNILGDLQQKLKELKGEN